ncbi:hypothetical protein ABA31_04810 [Agrococcus baldri]|uniref:AB hydrolase-1 domain-containing protein n=1 Tax=Agrococcus baldri TaxID=153730 RepID=A0AA87R9R9_9MICO|nr:hypothetical protein ABA31_04810 [Agrococcus baldri]
MSVRSAGALVRYDLDPEGDGHPLLLVHGGRAHHGWWQHLLPLLTEPRAVMDLSGHGASEWRDAYSYDDWAGDVTRVAEACALRTGRQIVVVAHSLGGIAALQPSVRMNDAVLAVISVEGVPMPSLSIRRSSSPSRGFTSIESALEHFRRARDRGRWRQDLVDSVALASIRRDGDRYDWAHDPRTVGVPHPRSIDSAPSPAAVLVGAQSAYRATVDDALSAGPAWLSRIEVPGVGHDMMMEAPERFVTTVREVVRSVTVDRG